MSNKRREETMQATCKGLENHLTMGAMDTVMKLYEVFYQASRHPENVQFATSRSFPSIGNYKSILERKKLTRRCCWYGIKQSAIVKVRRRMMHDIPRCCAICKERLTHDEYLYSQQQPGIFLTCRAHRKQVAAMNRRYLRREAARSARYEGTRSKPQQR